MSMTVEVVSVTGVVESMARSLKPGSDFIFGTVVYTGSNGQTCFARAIVGALHRDGAIVRYCRVGDTVRMARSLGATPDDDDGIWQVYMPA